MISKLLLSLIKREKLIANFLSFVMGSLTTAVGANVDEVYKLLCEGKTPPQMQSQLEDE